MAKMKLYQSYAWMKLKFVTEGLTQEEIAEEAGVAQATINRYLHQFKLIRSR